MLGGLSAMKKTFHFCLTEIDTFLKVSYISEPPAAGISHGSNNNPPFWMLFKGPQNALFWALQNS